MEESNDYILTEAEKEKALNHPSAKAWTATVNERGELVYSNSIVGMIMTRRNPTSQEIQMALTAYSKSI